MHRQRHNQEGCVNNIYFSERRRKGAKKTAPTTSEEEKNEKFSESKEKVCVLFSHPKNGEREKGEQDGVRKLFCYASSTFPLSRCRTIGI
jgi:hypothetical protein